MLGQNTHVYYIQHGSTGELRVTDERKWYVVEETWSGKRIVNERIVASCATEAEAATIRDQKEHK